MKSIRDIYVIGNGPSSSHTMGPAFAVDYIINKYSNIKYVEVSLYGSLALTGKGHLTDFIIDKRLKEHNIDHKIIFEYTKPVDHPNTMDFNITLEDGKNINERILSIGGGSILTSDGETKEKEIYPHNNLTEIMEFCSENELSLYDYVIKYEGVEILDYLRKVYAAMKHAISEGVNAEGVLPGSLQVKRKAKHMFEEASKISDPFTRKEMFVSVSAFAAAETNASGGIVCTAPTCGSSGVLPGVITYLKLKDVDEEKIIESLAVAGLIGKIVKTNASVSGAVCGCQAEIGTACSMGAALIMHAQGENNERIAQAAEMALEHSLGLTCDPIRGYVQIPCIERNAIFALKAINAANISSVIDKDSNLISFDDIVDTMYETGIDLKIGYRETSEKGMSKIKKFN